MNYFEDLAWLFKSHHDNRGVIRMNIAEAAMLYKFCKLKKDSPILEVGRKMGGSTVLMASALDSGTLYSIDKERYPQVDENIKSVVDKVILIDKRSEKVNWDTTVGLVFIDGDHSYTGVKHDIDKYTPHVEVGGYAVFHDVIGMKKQLRPLIKGLKKRGWKRAGQADTMLVLQKEEQQ